MNTIKNIEKTIAISSIWLVATVLVLAFNPLGYGFWQNAAVLIISGLVALGSIASLWVRYCTY